MNEAEFLRSLEAPRVTHLDIAGVPARIAMNDERVEAGIRRYFAPFLSTPARRAIRVTGIQGEPVFDPARLHEVQHKSGRPKVAVYDRHGVRVVLKKRSGVVHYVRRGHFYAVGDLIRNPQQIINLVSNAYAYRLRQDQHIALHASSVTRGGAGIAFAGHSGSGKSTVSLALMDFGFDYVSNDRTFLRRTEDGETVIAGVPRWPRVNPGTLLHSERLRGLLSLDKIARYGALDRSELWSIEDKHDVPVESVYGRGRLALHSSLKCLYVLTWKHHQRPLRLDPVDPQRVAALLHPYVKTEVYDPPESIDPSPLTLSVLTSATPVVEVTGGVDIPGLLERIVSGDQRALADSA